MSKSLEDDLDNAIVKARTKRKKLTKEHNDARTRESLHARRLFSSIVDDCQTLRDVLLSRVEGVQVDVLPRHLRIFCGARESGDFLMITLGVYGLDETFYVDVSGDIAGLQRNDSIFNNGSAALERVVKLVGEYLVEWPNKEMQPKKEEEYREKVTLQKQIRKQEQERLEKEKNDLMREYNVTEQELNMIESEITDEDRHFYKGMSSNEILRKKLWEFKNW